MKLIRTGIDSLDISYPLTLSEELADKMAKAREESEHSNSDVGVFMHNGVVMTVAQTGAKGGYAYRCDTGRGGPNGENWFFKRPNGRSDEWGVRVSCKALPLALYGLKAVRTRIEETLKGLELNYVTGTESIGRVDYAMDILAPNLEPERHHSLAHSRSSVSEIAELDIRTEGRSGRVETITIGKNPHRQIVLYDKRAEVIAKKKLFWVPIWNEALEGLGLPPLEMADRSTSAVWRIEVRAFKRHLKDRWNLTTWAHLRDSLPEILTDALDAIRYVLPNDDNNRARWPNHPIWNLAREAASNELFDLRSMVDPNSIAELIRQERAEMFEAQIKGCYLGLAGLNGISNKNLFSYVLANTNRMIREMAKDKRKAFEKLDINRLRYRL